MSKPLQSTSGKTSTVESTIAVLQDNKINKIFCDILVMTVFVESFPG